jgi:long-subunit acyl-CoA synthetase (AMP-forming)
MFPESSLNPPYLRYSCGVLTIHSNVKHLLSDLHHQEPDYLCTVPLVLQTLANKSYSKILSMRTTIYEYY